MKDEKIIIENLFKEYKRNDFLIRADGSVISYLEFWDDVKNFSSKLLSAGCMEGHFLLIQIENTEDYLKLYIACMLIGVIACPIDPNLPKKRVASIQNEIHPSYIINNIVFQVL